MKLDPHGPWVGPCEDDPYTQPSSHGRSGSQVKHNVTAYGYALRTANGLPPPNEPDRWKTLHRKKVMADPHWRQLAGPSKDGWVVPEAIAGGRVSVENLPSQMLKENQDYDQNGRPVRSRSALGGRNRGYHQSLSEAADHKTMTLHELRRKRKYKKWRPEGGDSEAGGSTLGSTAWSEFSQSQGFGATGSTEGFLGPVTSRLEEGLGNTTYSLHEQPQLATCLSQPTHLASLAHDLKGARWRGGRPNDEAKELYPAGIKGGRYEVSPDEVISTDYPGKQKMGVQRGAGENGCFRVDGKTRISFVPSKLTRTTYLSQQKRMHNTQALKGRRQKAGVRSEQYSKTPPAYISGTGVTMGGKLIGT